MRNLGCSANIRRLPDEYIPSPHYARNVGGVAVGAALFAGTKACQALRTISPQQVTAGVVGGFVIIAGFMVLDLGEALWHGYKYDEAVITLSNEKHEPMATFLLHDLEKQDILRVKAILAKLVAQNDGAEEQ